MHVELMLDPADETDWHRSLVVALQEHDISVRAGSGARTAPAALAVPRHGTSEPDDQLTIDLAGAASHVEPPTWRLFVDGAPGTAGAAPALRAGRFPLVQLRDETSTLVAEGRPGSESPGVIPVALDEVLAGVVTLVTQAVLGNRLRLSEGHETAGAADRPTPRPGFRIPPALRARTERAARTVYRTLYRTPHWRVGWRFVDGADLLDLPDVLPGGWTAIPDDGYHFYADPFPIEVDGVTHLFVEDYDHRVGKGVISVTEFGDNGPLGPPQPALTHEVHLSYPHVLADEGELWMIPETSAAGTVELYRATRFPDRWVREAVLLDGVQASDATPFQHEGRWWMTATVRHGGSWSDTLHVWHAPRLTGPWLPHGRQPLLLDIASARPAGRVVHRHGRLLRPVQDCSQGYGASLAIAEITTLDEDDFAQEVVGRYGPGDQWAGRRLHTLNRAGRVECIDGSALSSRLW